MSISSSFLLRAELQKLLTSEAKARPRTGRLPEVNEVR